MTDAATIITKIQNLREKASNEATSESEAIAAMAHASRLMEAYQISEVDLALAEAAGMVKPEVVARDSNTSIYKKQNRGAYGRQGHRHPVSFCAVNVGRVTGTEIINDHRVSSGMKIFGEKGAVEYADYLLAIIRNAMETEYARWKDETGYVGRGGKAKTSFQIAMATRINERLQEMIQERTENYRNPTRLIENRVHLDQQEKDKFALVYKGMVDQIQDEIQKLVSAEYYRLVSKNYAYSVKDGNAYTAGRKAGDNVYLGRGVGSDGSVKKLSHGAY